MTATIHLPSPAGPARPGRGSPRPGPGSPTPRRPDLSEREIEVLLTWLLADTKREVAERLFIADSTVNTYIQRVRGKYEAVGRPARTKVRLLIRALEDGLLGVDDL